MAIRATVKDMVEFLQTQDQSSIVLLSSDPEGNGFGTFGFDYETTKDPQFGSSRKILILYPLEQFAEVEDIKE